MARQRWQKPSELSTLSEMIPTYVVSFSVGVALVLFAYEQGPCFGFVELRDVGGLF